MLTDERFAQEIARKKEKLTSAFFDTFRFRWRHTGSGVGVHQCLTPCCSFPVTKGSQALTFECGCTSSLLSEE
jgi:hypothetical protein